MVIGNNSNHIYKIVAYVIFGIFIVYFHIHRT